MPTIKRYTAENSQLDPGIFVPLLVPVRCNAYMIKNSGSDTLYMRSDPNDADTEDTLAPGAIEGLTIPPPLPGCDHPRYDKGVALYYVKCTGPIIGKFWM